MPKTTPLLRAGTYHIGQNAHTIEMVRDGAGPMGWYDVIYVRDYCGKTLAVMPAHLVPEWEPIETNMNTMEESR